jgi:hypothetical protein
MAPRSQCCSVNFLELCCSLCDMAASTGGWLLSKKARVRWGGASSCSIRVLSAAEWKSASPECLAALFTRPFMVQVCWRADAASACDGLPPSASALSTFRILISAQGLDDTIVDARRFRREHLLSLGSQSTVKISSLGGACNAIIQGEWM